MTVHFIGAGPGDPELITVRALRLIETCKVCLYAGSLVPPAIVEAAPDDALVMDTASMTLDEIIDEIAKAHEKGWMLLVFTPAIHPYTAQLQSKCAAWMSWALSTM